MDLKDIQGLLGLNPEFAGKVQRALEDVRAGKLPDFIDPSRGRQERLAGMRERLKGLQSAREESLQRFDADIHEQEDAIARLEAENGSPVRVNRVDDRRATVEAPDPAERADIPLRSNRNRR